MLLLDPRCRTASSPDTLFSLSVRTTLTIPVPGSTELTSPMYSIPSRSRLVSIEAPPHIQTGREAAAQFQRHPCDDVFAIKHTEVLQLDQFTSCINGIAV